CQLLLEPMGGAISKMGDDETALGRRDVSWCYHALAMWMEPGEEAEAAHRDWARKLATDLEPETTEGVYLNFTSDEGEERVRKSGTDSLARQLPAVAALLLLLGAPQRVGRVLDSACGFPQLPLRLLVVKDHLRGALAVRHPLVSLLARLVRGAQVRPELIV